MEDVGSAVAWVGAVWLALVLALIVLPSALGVSLGISEAYMWVLVKTLEVGGGHRPLSPVSSITRRVAGRGGGPRGLSRRPGGLQNGAPGEVSPGAGVRRGAPSGAWARLPFLRPGLLLSGGAPQPSGAGAFVPRPGETWRAPLAGQGSLRPGEA